MRNTSSNPDVWPEGLLTRPAREPTAPGIVILHGLGASMEDLAGMADFVDPDGRFRWFFPNAPMRPVRLHAGGMMRAWYDIHGLDAQSSEDAEGLRDMASRLTVLLDHAADRGAPLILGGFSQGGAMSLYSALHAGYPVAAVLALSTYLPLRTQVPGATTAKSPPIFWAHGQRDTVLPPQYMDVAEQILTPLGYSVARHRYAMAHSLCEEELLEMRAFLRTITDLREAEPTR